MQSETFDIVILNWDYVLYTFIWCLKGSGHWHKGQFTTSKVSLCIWRSLMWVSDFWDMEMYKNRAFQTTFYVWEPAGFGSYCLSNSCMHIMPGFLLQTLICIYLLTYFVFRNELSRRKMPGTLQSELVQPKTLWS